MTTYAFIPARANSKRVPGKNYKNLNGKPLIYWTIKAAIMSRVDRVYLSTESEKLAEIANDLAFDIDPRGSKFDVLHRDPKLSQDHVQTDEVFLDMLRTIEKSGSIKTPDCLVLLQPTSPLRDADDINDALNQWNSSNKKGSLISGHMVDGFYWHMNGKSSNADPLNGDPRFRLGGQWIQEYTVKENGAIYICNAKEFSLYRSYRMPPYQMFVMSKRKSVDIDLPADWQRAYELMLNHDLSNL